MPFYFDITPEELGRLTPHQAVTVFRDLVFAEAKLVKGVDLAKVVVPSSNKAIVTRDGGIDGQVSDANPQSEGHGIIKSGLTCYQVKTGDADVNTTKKAIKVISTKEGICPRVKDCVERGGTLIIVLFGSDKPDEERDHAISCVQEAIEHCMPAYPAYPHVDVWRQSQLIGFLQDFPSLCLAAKQQRPTELQTIDMWANLREMQHAFIVGESQAQIITAIRESMSNENDEALRIVGEAGVGKTRLTLEALNTEECKGLVIYAAKPSSIPGGFINSLTMIDSKERCILVVDECDTAKCDELWNQIAPVAERIKLVTLFNVGERVGYGQAMIAIDPLSDDEIRQIISTYGIADYRASELATFCSGSPRIAHMLGEQISTSGDFDISKTENVWLRCIAGPNDPTSEMVYKRFRILKWLALFRRFGYEGPYANEGNTIIAKIQQETGIKACEIREVIRDLRSKKFLQGDFTLYITPRMLHIWLWIQWWEEQGPGFNFAEFKRIDDERELSNQLINWFCDMLQYGRESAIVPRVVQNFFSDEGPFASPAFLQSSSGERLLSLLADIAPCETLAFIERQLAPLDVDGLFELRSGRRGYVDSLQRIARETSLFSRAAAMLLKLALAENEFYANNATGVFCDLFSNGIGVFAPSEAPAETRFVTLKAIAETEDKVQQAIAIRAISNGLDVVTSTLREQREVDMLHEDPTGWTPATYSEWWDAYRRTWSLGMQCLSAYEGDNQIALANEMIKRGLHLVDCIGDGTEVVNWLSDLAASGYANKEELVRGVSNTLEYSKHLSVAARESLVSLQEKLIGAGYENEMRRYVGMSVFEDEYGLDGSREHQLDEKLEDLAKQSLSDQRNLNNLLPWLISAKPARAFKFGVAIGRQDEGHAQWSAILGALKDNAQNEDGNRNADASKPDVRFCSGYLRSIFEDDVVIWEQCIFEIAEQPNLVELVPTIACQSGMTNSVFSLISDLYEQGTLSVESIQPLRLCIVVVDNKGQAIEKLLNLLIDRGEPPAANLAIGIAHTYMRGGRSLPTKLRLALVTQKTLFEGGGQMGGAHNVYLWKELCCGILDEMPESAYDITAYAAEAVSSNAQWEQLYVMDVFRSAAKVNSSATWEAIASYFESNDLDVTNCFGSWLRTIRAKDRVPIEFIPSDIITHWIDEDVDGRALAVATVIPSSLRNDDGSPMIAREILARYGKDTRIRQALHAQELSYSWTGSEVPTLQAKIERLRLCKDGETNTNVLQWIDEIVATLTARIDTARAQEEREW